MTDSRQYFERRQKMHKQLRARAWHALRNCRDAAGHRNLQAAVSDWMWYVLPELGFSPDALSFDAPGLDGLWSEARLAGDVTGLREAREVFLARDIELLPVWFLRAIAVAVNNAVVVLYDLPVHPPVEIERTESTEE